MARQERAIRTRQVILEAAGAVFDEHGYAATTISMVLERAAVTKGALYFHFPSKESLAQAVLDERGGTLVHAFADPWVIEGQGSTGIELAAQMERQAGGPPTRIVTPCGGGGLTSGLALACPDAEMIPVEPEGWDDVCRSLEAGSIQRVARDAPPTACDALQTPATRPINFAVLKERCHNWLRVSEAEVAAAQRFAFSHLRVVVEPGGAVALAALLAGRAPIDGRTAIVLSGGNVDAARFAQVLAAEN